MSDLRIDIRVLRYDRRCDTVQFGYRMERAIKLGVDRVTLGSGVTRLLGLIAGCIIGCTPTIAIAASASATTPAPSPVLTISHWNDPNGAFRGPHTCTTPSPNGYICTATLTLDTTYGQDQATFTDSASSLSGTLTGTICTSTGSETKTSTFPPGSPGVVTFSNSTENDDCSVHLAYHDAQNSTIVMDLHNDNYDPNSNGAVTVSGSIESGTGIFAGDVGSWSETVPPSGHAGPLRSALEALDNNAMVWRARLHKGATQVAVAYPGTGARVTGATDVGLRIVSAAHVACKATASSGAKSVALGSATIGTNGSALMVAKLRTELHLGNWTIAVTCGIASVHSLVRIS